MSKSRLYAKITTLGHAIEQQIPPGEKRTIEFLAEYTPHLTPRLPSELTLFFGIFVYDDKGEIQIRIGPRKINLLISNGDTPVTPEDDYIL